MNKPSKKSVLVFKKIKSLFVDEAKEVKLLGIIILVGLVLIIGLALSSSKSSFKKESNVEGISTPADCEFRSNLTGVCVENAAAKTPALVAVMIENHPEARPQAGLAEAEVVYEAMVEGNYTRFLAIYPYDKVVTKVGPVRSARPYYLDWLEEYGNPLYMHVGGSPDALTLIAQRKIWDVNEFFFGNSFWRATNRYAPHNTYTNTERWQKLIGQETVNKFIPWTFTTSTPTCVSRCVQTVEIPYLRPDFVAIWKFNSSTNNYERWQGNMPHKTESSTIHADTIVIMEAPIKVLDDVGRLEMKTIGSCPVIVIMAGQKISGTWQKSALTERTNFYDQAGQEINFKPGKIWVQVVPRLAIVQITQL